MEHTGALLTPSATQRSTADSGCFDSGWRAPGTEVGGLLRTFLLDLFHYHNTTAYGFGGKKFSDRMHCRQFGAVAATRRIQEIAEALGYTEFKLTLTVR